MKKLLKDKTIRMHIFGMFQWFIGIFCLGYLTSQSDNLFEACLSVFTCISLLFGMINIKKAEKRMIGVTILRYLIAKAEKDEATINICLQDDTVQYLLSIDKDDPAPIDFEIINKRETNYERTKR